MDPARTPVISFNALRRARTTIEDFVLSYFPYHSLTTQDFLSKYWDTLVFVEATIYQLDEENEEATARQVGDMATAVPGAEERYTVLLAVLEQLSLRDERVQVELHKGRCYWQLERDICAQLARPRLPRLQNPGGGLTLEDVHTASMSKSFDYRVLNLLLFQLTDTPYDEAQLAFLAVDEHLVDIGDDLYDYEDDVLNNSFNIFRAYVYLFGRDAQMQLIVRISELERQHMALLARLPPDFQQKFHARHKEAAAEPGAEKWVFPVPVLDEVAYRTDNGA